MAGSTRHSSQASSKGESSSDDSARVLGAHQSERSGSTTAKDQADALDAVLDDIETTLQGNAEEYVNGFVQQGGQ